MKKVLSIKNKMYYGKSKFLLFISTVAFLCLSLILSKVGVGTFVLLLGLLMLFSRIVRSEQSISLENNQCIFLFSAIIALIILNNQVMTFFDIYAPSRKVKYIAELLHIPKEVFLALIAIIGCIFGFYAAYYFSHLSLCFVRDKLIEKLPCCDQRADMKNIRKNLLLVLSAGAYFCLNINLDSVWLQSFIMAVVCVSFFASQCTSVFSWCRQKNKALLLASFLSSAGTCQCGYEALGSYFAENREKILRKVPVGLKAFRIFRILVVITAAYFVFVFTLYILDRLISKCRETRLFDDVKWSELAVYAFAFAALSILCIVSFLRSQAFWGTEHSIDIIYTSDSPKLLKTNVYLNLLSGENDLRQPLFAVFATPFMGIPYLLGRIAGGSECVLAIAMNIVQIFLLLFTFFLLTKMLKLSPMKRICFVLVFCSAYTTMLFSLMMEQYIIATFWLVWAVYLMCEEEKPDLFFLYGAGGTLLTSAVLIPFSTGENPVRSFSKWIRKVLEIGLGFVFLLFAFCHSNVIFCLKKEIESLLGFTGVSVSSIGKIYQYSAFISNCFAAPRAGAAITPYIEGRYLSWQLEPIHSLSIPGVLLFVGAVLGWVVSRKKKDSMIAGGWVIFSVVILLILGWGTAENGLILYSLYFGWAFLVLLFRLVEAAEEKLGVKWIVPAVSAAAVIVLLSMNIPAIGEMLKFAITEYPA